ncbi:MAG TPA: hypothetical protein VF097_01885 [Actinomycetota bacterium]
MGRTLICLVLLASGCTGTEPPEAGPTGTPPAEQIQRESHLVAGHDRPELPCLEAGPDDPPPRLEMGDTFFAPSCVVLRGRHDLRLANGGALEHSFGVRDAGVSVDLEPGASGEVSLEDLRGSGSTEFFCRFHASAGMTGTITVA